MTAPSLSFQDAATYLSNAPSLGKVSNAVKLELYGLYKHVTVSPTPNTTRPSLWDMTGRAKWDSWSAAGSTYKDSAGAAEVRYLELARELGWSEGTREGTENNATVNKRGNESDEGLPENWEDDDAGGPNSATGGGGMVVVSSISAPPEANANTDTLHGLATLEDAGGLSKFLEEHPEANVNAFDEFGYTPLHLASDRGNAPAVEMLLKHGADPNIKDQDDYTALELAKVAGHRNVAALIETVHR